MVTRAASQSSEIATLFSNRGATVLEVPSLEIVPPSSYAPLDAAIAELSSYDWLVLTSANAVDYFMGRLLFIAATSEPSIADQSAYEEVQQMLEGVKVAVVGKKTEALTLRWGFEPDFIPPKFDADSLLEHFPGRNETDGLKGVRILFPRVESGGREVLTAGLRELGAIVTEVAAYESRCPKSLPESALRALEDGEVDFVTFASSKTVRNFAQMLQGAATDTVEVLAGEAETGQLLTLDNTALQDLADTTIVSIGPQTSEACREVLGRVDVEAEVYTIEGLVQAVEAYVQKQHQS